MNQLQGKFTITYHWKRPDDQPVLEDHVDALEVHTWERVNEMATSGFTSGELADYVRITDDDPEDGVHYTGWWNLETESSICEGNGTKASTNAEVTENAA